MNHICPVCNGLVILEEYCPNCREIIAETTTARENLEPYAPYEFQHTEAFSGISSDSINTENDLSESIMNDCIHKVICPNCDVTWNISVNKVTL